MQTWPSFLYLPGWWQQKITQLWQQTPNWEIFYFKNMILLFQRNQRTKLTEFGVLVHSSIMNNGSLKDISIVYQKQKQKGIIYFLYNMVLELFKCFSNSYVHVNHLENLWKQSAHRFDSMSLQWDWDSELQQLPHVANTAVASVTLQVVCVLFTLGGISTFSFIFTKILPFQY